MRKQELEARVYRIVQNVERREPREDSFVELKTAWLSDNDFQKTAARLGGLANAARGELILWLIGIDEVRGVLGADEQELANWLPQMVSQFEGGLAPHLHMTVNIPIGDKTVVALLFETDRAPYVVKTKQGNPEFFVPYRQGNRTRAARRTELLEMLLPAVHLPVIEILTARALYYERTKSSSVDEGYLDENQEEISITFDIRVEMYIESEIASTVVIPFHRSSLELTVGSEQRTYTATNFRIRPPMHSYGHRVVRTASDAPLPKPESLSPFIDGTPSDLIIKGPGQASIECVVRTQITRHILEAAQKLHIEFRLQPLNTPQAVGGKVTLPRDPKPETYMWLYKSNTSD